jgi:hypothetical protein
MSIITMAPTLLRAATWPVQLPNNAHTVHQLNRTDARRKLARHRARRRGEVGVRRGRLAEPHTGELRIAEMPAGELGQLLSLREGIALRLRGGRPGRLRRGDGPGLRLGLRELFLQRLDLGLCEFSL